MFLTSLQLAAGVALALAAAHTAIGAPSVSITADPPIIAAGSQATLRWTATGANSCGASGSWAGTQLLTGELVLTPSAAGVYPYTLTCTGSQGTTGRDSVLLQVTASGFKAGEPMFVFMLDFTTQAPEALPLPFTGVGWGWYPQGRAVDDSLKAHVDLWKARKGPYFTAINLNRLYGATAPAEWDASRLRALDGSYLPDRYSGGAPTYTISSPDWQAFLRTQAKNSVDAGADGMLIDDIRSDVVYMSGLAAREAVSFDAFTMAAFRVYLHRNYTAQQLQARFGIAESM